MTSASLAQLPERTRKRREAAAEEIKAVAMDMLRQGEALTLRAIARRVALTPSALYRYFPSRDAIVTEILIDAHNDVANTVEKVAADHAQYDSGTQILSVLHAFRSWALEHEYEYGLMYGAPVAGYQRDDAVQGAVRRLRGVLLSVLQRAVNEGDVVPPTEPLPEAVDALMQKLADANAGVVPGDFPLELWAAASQFWVVVYGAINAELFGYLPVPIGGSVEFFDHAMRTALLGLGGTPEAVARARVLPADG